MKDRPILFSGPMVKAILEGRKTQTRRVVKLPAGYIHQNVDLTRLQDGFPDGTRPVFGDCDCEPNAFSVRNPHGQPGDRLWVKETWGLCSHHDPTDWCGGSIRGVSESELREQFLVEHRQNWITHPDSAYWRPSIFMPRWASRITLEITGVRLERLNEISEADAKAEGLKAITKDGEMFKYGIPDRDGLPGTDDYGWPWKQWRRDPREAYRTLWGTINGPGSWDANPFVWVVEFKRI